MTPAYPNDSAVLVSTRFDPLKIRRNDVVVFRHEGEQYIKRVAYLGCDQMLQIRQAGIAKRWNTLYYTSPVKRFKAMPTRTVTVPAGTVFVLSDDPTSETDSRFLGPIPLSEIEGVVVKPRPAS